MNLRDPRKRIRTLVLVALFASCAAVPRLLAQGGEPRSFAIKDARVVPVSSAPLPHSTVVVVRGVITAVGPDVPIPPDAWVIDGNGLTVYPGLFDAFSDVGLAPASAAPPAGADAGTRPTSRGPEDRPATAPWRQAADEIDLGDPRIESWRTAGFTTTAAAPKAGIFPGQSAVLNLAGERPGDLVVKSPVAIPVSLAPLGGFRSFPGSQMGSIAYVRQVWIDTSWSAQAEGNYAKNSSGIPRPRYDRTEATLNEALQKRPVVLLNANTSLQIRRALKLAGEWKLNAVLYGGQMSYDVAGEIAAKKMPVLVDLKWPEAPKDADPDEVPSLRELRFRDRATSSPAALEQAGVKFAFYSGGMATPKDILPAVKKAIDAGLAPEAALRALTLSPAEIYGVSNMLGSIETGKIANLTVTDGDLFQKKTKIKIVFVDGRKFEIHEPLRPAEPPKGDITGKWKLAYVTPEGAEEATADLTMASDGAISGTVATGSRGTGTIFTGYLSEDKFTFTISLSIEGSPTDVRFSGTFDGSSLKGSIAAMGYTFDFTGTKPARASVNEGGAL